MVIFAARLASVVMALVMSGTPTLLQACTALCSPEMRHEHRSATAPDVTPAIDAHAHHDGHQMDAAMTARHTPPIEGARVAAATAAHARQVSGVVPPCCPDTTAMAAVPTAASRHDVPTVLAPAMTSTSAVWLHAPARILARAARHRALPPAPARPPLVLRI